MNSKFFSDFIAVTFFNEINITIVHMWLRRILIASCGRTALNPGSLIGNRHEDTLICLQW